MSSTNTHQNQPDNSILAGYYAFYDRAKQFNIDLNNFGLNINDYGSNRDLINKIALFKADTITYMVAAVKDEYFVDNVSGDESGIGEELHLYSFRISSADLCNECIQFNYPIYQRSPDNKVINKYAESFRNRKVSGVKTLTLMAPSGFRVLNLPEDSRVLIVFTDNLINFDVIDGQHNIRAIVDNNIKHCQFGNLIKFGVNLIDPLTNKLRNDCEYLTKVGSNSFITINDGKKVAGVDKKVAKGVAEYVKTKEFAAKYASEYQLYNINQTRLHTIASNFYAKSDLYKVIDLDGVDASDWFKAIFDHILQANSECQFSEYSAINHNGFFTVLGRYFVYLCKHEHVELNASNVLEAIKTSPLFGNEIHHVNRSDRNSVFCKTSGGDFSNNSHWEIAVIKQIYDKKLIVV